MNIKYQTSALVPAPYAYAIQLDLEVVNAQTLKFDFDLEYLDRDQLTEEEIFEEGFTLDDNIQQKGNLGSAWVEEFNLLLSKTEKTDKTELEDDEDFWYLNVNNSEFYPKNYRQWATFLEQIRQAILEVNGIEKPLEINIVEVNNGEKRTTFIKGSFANRTLIHEQDGKIKSIKWSLLSGVLKDLCSADFDYETAKQKPRNADGIYINFGDEYWFELGKSYINNPKKVKAWL